MSILTNPKIFNISPRRFSVSTVGVIPAIQRVTKEFPQVISLFLEYLLKCDYYYLSLLLLIKGYLLKSCQIEKINLAFSLHSPFPEQRDVIVPVNKTYPMENVLEALDEHVNITNRKVFIAYLVLTGHNDSEDHAKKVAELIHHKRPSKLRHLFHINLLRYNPVRIGDEIKYAKTSEESINRFKELLEKYGIVNITVRQSFGVDIDAACGQLFAKYEAKKISLPQ